MENLHTLLICLIILTSFFVFLSDNPVHSVIFLILTFCNAASTSILFKADFLGLLFIIIYVGAIAVLFLFVVMMLNVKIYTSFQISYLPVVFLGSLIVCTQLSMGLKNLFFDVEIASNDFASLFLIDNFSNIDIFGQILYNNFLVCFLIAGVVLLVAMIGAIVLTLKFTSNRKTEIVYRQLSRSNFIPKI